MKEKEHYEEIYEKFLCSRKVSLSYTVLKQLEQVENLFIKTLSNEQKDIYFDLRALRRKKYFIDCFELIDYCEQNLK